MTTRYSSSVWHCNYCGESFYSESESAAHYRRMHRPQDAQPCIYGKCDDCGHWLTAVETITHRCEEAERRRASAGWWPVVAAVVIVAAIAWIVGRMMR